MHINYFFTRRERRHIYCRATMTSQCPFGFLSRSYGELPDQLPQPSTDQKQPRLKLYLLPRPLFASA
jgi:hypothetical protein